MSGNVPKAGSRNHMQDRSRASTRTRYRVVRRRTPKDEWVFGIVMYQVQALAERAAQDWRDKGWKAFIERISIGQVPKP